MVESLAACVYTEPDGSKQAGGEDTNTLFSEGLNLEYCFGLCRCCLVVLGTFQTCLKNQGPTCIGQCGDQMEQCVH